MIWCQIIASNLKCSLVSFIFRRQTGKDKLAFKESREDLTTSKFFIYKSKTPKASMDCNCFQQPSDSFTYIYNFSRYTESVFPLVTKI